MDASSSLHLLLSPLPFPQTLSPGAETLPICLLPSYRLLASLFTNQRYLGGQDYMASFANLALGVQAVTSIILGLFTFAWIALTKNPKK